MNCLVARRELDLVSGSDISTGRHAEIHAHIVCYSNGARYDINAFATALFSREAEPPPL